MTQLEVFQHPGVIKSYEIRQGMQGEKNSPGGIVAPQNRLGKVRFRYEHRAYGMLAFVPRGVGVYAQKRVQPDLEAGFFKSFTHSGGFDALAVSTKPPGKAQPKGSKRLSIKTIPFPG